MLLVSKIAKTLNTATTLASQSVTYRIAYRTNAERPLVGSLVFKRYYLISVIGTGGMSVVYKAKDIKHGLFFQKKFVALKTLNYKWSNDGLTVKRFAREAEALSMLNHKGIVQIYDFNETEDGQPFFVMDYLQGVTLASVLKAGSTITSARMLDIFSQVFDAVEHAHKHGLVHRDLKPSNLMLLKQANGREKVKVVDFGIAKLQQEVQKLTRLGEVWGSPVYMSPEQCMGAPIDYRSDIYSLAITIYECLSGQLPFYGESYFETMSQKINARAKPLRESRPDLNFSQELDSVLTKAMQKDPQKRFQSMAEFKQALHKALPGLSSWRQKTLEVIVKKPHTKKTEELFLAEVKRVSFYQRSRAVIIFSVTTFLLLLCLLWFYFSWASDR